MDFPHRAWTEADANYLRVALLTHVVRSRHFDGMQKVFRFMSKTNPERKVSSVNLRIMLLVILLISQATYLKAGA